MDTLSPYEAIQLGYDRDVLTDISQDDIESTVTFKQFMEDNIDFVVVRYDAHRFAIRRKERDFLKALDYYRNVR